MKILLWHGYLLTGSGSNLYTANLARVWREAGHDVLVMCQERHVEEFPFIDAVGDFEEDNSRFALNPVNNNEGPGSCRLLRPNIGRILPVYVFDEYEGFQAKTFVDLTDEELSVYTNSNVEAMVTAIKEFQPDAIVTGHEVMGPYIALKACRQTGHEYLAKLHGSALEYAVKKQKRYVRYAYEGLSGAKVVAGGSNYMVREALSVIAGWGDRAHVVNPGCDIGLFKPVEKNNDGPTVGYVGKWIAAKGVHNFLAGLGLTNTISLKAVLVGYGGYENELRSLWDALRSGDADTVMRIARNNENPLVHIEGFAEAGGLDDGFHQTVGSVRLEWAGRLDHGPLSKVLPTFDALVVPSVVPEAFGMVAAEAAACAVLPIVPRHSGIGEIGALLEAELERPGLLTFDPDDPVRGIAEAIDRIFRLERAERRELEQKASGYARSVWSWDHVGEQLLDLATH